MSDVILGTVYKHLQGKHDQKTHGRKGAGSSVGIDKNKVYEIGKRFLLTENDLEITGDTVNARGEKVMGEYIPVLNKIKIYPKNITNPDVIVGVIAHENTHRMFQTVREKAGREYNEFSRTDEWKNNKVYDKKKYPNYTTWRKISGSDWESLSSFSNYASSFWKKGNSTLAINETLAEASRYINLGHGDKVPKEVRDNLTMLTLRYLS